jgi:acyl-CoA thioester hydrolase
VTVGHTFSHTVQIHDTDCYGVVWHGTYSRWLETGRVGLCEQLGLPIEKPGVAQYLYPVVDQHLRFKASATVGDAVQVSTTLRIAGMRLVFEQVVNHGPKVLMEAMTTCVVVNTQWQIQRRLPPRIRQALMQLQ